MQYSKHKSIFEKSFMLNWIEINFTVNQAMPVKKPKRRAYK